MFENIIGQKNVVDELKRAIETDTLPGSLLFCGERYSGKLSCALELARTVSCTGDRSWGCNCNSCKAHRLLIYPYLQILGNTSFMEEIELCAKIVKNNKAVFARYMFIRSVRKLLKRFDPILWEGSESKYKQAAGSAAKTEEYLREINPANITVQDESKFEKLIDRIVNESSKVAESINSDNIPIDQIRRISSWVHTASTSKKIIILENADLMNDSSRNSLLKLLEEPPANCVFILISRRRGAIIPTILSRVRLYNFHDRSSEETALVIEKVFRENSEKYQSIKDLFISLEIDLNSTKNLAANFMKEVTKTESKAERLEDLGDFKNLLKNRNSFNLFIEECLEILRADLKNGLDHEFVYNLGRLFSEAKNRLNGYNQSAQLVIEALYYQAGRLKQ